MISPGSPSFRRGTPRIAAALCVGLVLVSGCGRHQNTESGDWVAEQWDLAMLSYHISPVYPPTEDIHIGDIYGIPEDADEAAPTPGSQARSARSIKLDYVPMQKQLEAYYSQVPVLPETADAPGAGQIWRQRPAAEPGAETPRSAFAQASMLTRLPLVGFPGFSLSSTDAESGSVGLPAKLFSAVFGGGRKHQDAVTIQIRAAETYGVPAVPATNALIDYCDANPYICDDKYVRERLATVIGRPPGGVAISLISRLYLVRSIEYRYDTSTAIGAQGKVLAELRTNLAAQKALAAQSQPKAGDAPQAAGAGAGQSLASLQSQIAADADQLGTASMPGATFSVGYANEQGVSLVQTFERPVAIGYRAESFHLPLSPRKN